MLNLASRTLISIYTDVIIWLIMTYKVRVTTVGNSTGIVLPKELLQKLKIQKGDTLYVTETPDGVQMTPYQEEFARTMEVAEDIMRRYRDTLKQLAQ